MSNAKRINLDVISYQGVKLPREVVHDLKEAKKLWRERDQKSWQFAYTAYKIVGRYIPDATKLLAKSMGVDSVSTPEGYAKAYFLKSSLLEMGYKYFPNLFISHYIVAGKAFAAHNINLDDAYELLKWCSKYEVSVDKLRAKLAGKMGGDDWRASAMRIRELIDHQIINAPYTGVNDAKAATAALVGRMFVRFLDWAVSDRQDNGYVHHEAQAMFEITEDIFRDDSDDVTLPVPPAEEIKSEHIAAQVAHVVQIAKRNPSKTNNNMLQ